MVFRVANNAKLNLSRPAFLGIRVRCNAGATSLSGQVPRWHNLWLSESEPNAISVRGILRNRDVSNEKQSDGTSKEESSFGAHGRYAG
jgi:hypothetical protein